MVKHQRRSGVERVREQDEESKTFSAEAVGYYRLERSYGHQPGRRASDRFAKVTGPRAARSGVEQTHGRISDKESEISAMATSCWYLAIIGGKGFIALAHADNISYFKEFLDAYETLEEPAKCRVYMVKGNGVSQKTSANRVFSGFKDKLAERGYPPPVEDFEVPVAGEPRGDNTSFIEARREGYVTVVRFHNRSVSGPKTVYDLTAPETPGGKPLVRVYPPDEADKYVQGFIDRL